MEPWLVENIAMVLGMTIMIGGGLGAMSMIMRYRLRRKEMELQGNPELMRTVEELKGELVDTRAELTELHERVEFAERLLTRQSRAEPE